MKKNYRIYKIIVQNIKGCKENKYINFNSYFRINLFTVKITKDINLSIQKIAQIFP